MATITQNTISLYSTSALPAEFYIRTAQPSVEATVAIGSMTRFSTTLYAYNGMATLYDIRTIVEQALFDDANQLSTVTITATDSDSSDSVSFAVIYNDFRIPDMAQFLDHHFLTTKRAYTIHPDAYQYVYWFAKGNQNHTRRIDSVIENVSDKTIHSVTLQEETLIQNMDDVITETVRPSEILTRIQQQIPTLGNIRLCSFTLHRGSHSISFYISEETPNINFAFCNGFNAMEMLNLHAVTRRKQTVTQSEANILRDHIQYDRQTEHSYEVETSALTPDEAIHLEQFLRSPYIEIYHDASNRSVIIITDSTSEISDADDEQIHIKFTYKYANSNIPHIRPAIPQIFTNHFQPPFQ